MIVIRRVPELRTVIRQRACVPFGVAVAQRRRRTPIHQPTIKDVEDVTSFSQKGRGDRTDFKRDPRDARTQGVYSEQPREAHRGSPRSFRPLSYTTQRSRRPRTPDPVTHTQGGAA